MIEDTIVALSSGAGRAGVAVIRISGPGTAALVKAIAGVLPEPRRATLRRFRRSDGDVLDQGLVLWFPEGASFTGEASAEFHCHGGRAVVAAMLDAIVAFPGCRMAEPGEFTLRAFRCGRMTLADVEALGDLVAAETEMQRRHSLRLVGGAVQALSERWRRDLVRASALVEVTIDWADEEVPDDVGPEVLELMGHVLADMAGQVAQSAGAERLRNGFEVALIGAPNSGKSSIINRLAGRDAAITSPVPGTTRDIVELRYDLDGLPVVFLDTAGLRETDDPVEAEGVRRAIARAEAADIRVLLSAPDAPFPERYLGLQRVGDHLIATKSDLGEVIGFDQSISVVSGQGIGEMLDFVARSLRSLAEDAGLIGHQRQLSAIEQARGALVRAQDCVKASDLELAAEELRVAIRALQRLIGAVDVEDVLEEVFASFCLGK